MVKFTILLFSALVTDFYANERGLETVPADSFASIIYTEPAVDYESGQPVFSQQVRATLFRKSNHQEVRLVINDLIDITIDTQVIELYELVEFKEGTYTVQLVTDKGEETFGFTIR